MRKVGLIGCGHVGATVALDIVQGGLVDELIIIDKKREKAEALLYFQEFLRYFILQFIQNQFRVLVV